MNVFKDRLQVFFLGLMLGLLIGGGFFLLKFDEYISNLTSKNKKKSTEQEIVQKVEPEESEKKIKKEKKDKKLQDLVVGTDTATYQVADTTSVKDSIPSDEMVIRQEEIITTKNINLIQLDVTDPGNPQTDSIAKAAGIKEPKPASVYTVEFWRSPLNYRGYKMARNKIVVFGVNQTEGIKLYRLDNDTYLKTILGVYKIEPTSEYRQLEIIDDEVLLSRLEK